MEPVELNGGRFYLRPITVNDRINDVPALTLVAQATPAAATTPTPDIATTRRQQWLSGTALSWAVCEQTQVELLAEAMLIPVDGRILSPEEQGEDGGDGGGAGDVHSDIPTATRAIVQVLPAGDTTRILPNDPDVEQKTVGDAVAEAQGTIARWAEGYLGLQVTIK